MARKSWQVDRRTLLRGTGNFGLPWLDAMAWGAVATRLPKRFCCVYFPFVCVPGDNSQVGSGGGFLLAMLISSSRMFFRHLSRCVVTSPLSAVSLIQRMVNGWARGDIFLTGSLMKTGLSPIRFQLAGIAEELGQPPVTSLHRQVMEAWANQLDPARCPFRGGANSLGLNPAQIFDRLFGDEKEERLHSNDANSEIPAACLIASWNIPGL